MKQIEQKLKAIAGEYAKEFGEIIGMSAEFPIGSAVSAWSYGEFYIFSFDEMVEVVDNIRKYVKKYGSLEAVGQEILDWVHWWTDGFADAEPIEYAEARITHQMRPNINLKSWLDGCPRIHHAWNSENDELIRMKDSRKTLYRLLSIYDESRSMKFVLDDMQKRIENLAQLLHRSAD